MSRAFFDWSPHFGGLPTAACAFLRLVPRLDSGNLRVQYGLSHLGAALAWMALATLAALVAVRGFSRVPWGGGISRRRAILLILAIYAAVWLPAWWAGGFVMDDWRLLAAASVRKLVMAHPLLSLSTLDSVDGNFRPLGTVLYFGYMLRWFGSHAAHVFTLGPLGLTLASVLLVYAIVLEMGYSRVVALVGAVLFATRGMLYTVVTWTAALGDSISLALCGVSALLLLRACRTTGWRVGALHALAWLAFAVATLGKQSAFAMPLIAALILWMRPGRCSPATLVRRASEAAAALAVYGATAALVFWHAKNLLHAPSPYPIAPTWGAVLRLLAYPTWYIAVLQFPARWGYADSAAEVLGLALAALATWLVVVRTRHGETGRRDGRFAFLAGAASLWMLALLQTRAAPYYGCMFAFWISIAFAILMFPGGRRSPVVMPRRAAVLGVVLLTWSGYCEVRLEQTGLAPSGGYIWGSYNGAVQRAFREALDQRLEEATDKRTVLFVGCSDRIAYPAIALLDAPWVQQILIEDSSGGEFFANNHEGLRPADDVPGLTDPGAYSWTVPLNGARVPEILSGGSALEMPCTHGDLPPGANRRQTGLAGGGPSGD